MRWGKKGRERERDRSAALYSVVGMSDGERELHCEIHILKI